MARYEAAIELANLWCRTGLVVAATENDGWSPEQVAEDEPNALFQSKVVPFVPCEGADGTVAAVPVAGRPNWDLLATITHPAEIRKAR